MTREQHKEMFRKVEEMFWGTDTDMVVILGYDKDRPHRNGYWAGRYAPDVHDGRKGSRGRNSQCHVGEKKRETMKIISGGQTGPDRISLEVARNLGLPTGGTAAKGFMTENGPDLSLKEFGLVESDQDGYPPRTEANVIDSQGTVLFGDQKSPGSKLTIALCKKHSKPSLSNPTPQALYEFIMENGIGILNVAGNRASRLTAYQMEHIRYVLTEALEKIKV